MSLTLVVFAQILAAAPTVSSAQFKCESKSNVQAPWDDRGAVSIQSDNAAVQLNFIPGGSSQLDGMGFMSTTNQDSEFRVEARCPGQFIVKSASPIRIRDFVFQVRDFAEQICCCVSMICELLLKEIAHLIITSGAARVISSIICEFLSKPANHKKKWIHARFALSWPAGFNDRL
ncbi:MAG: hypothetical protein NTX25_22525 [Proteobacteria bacterium]|nr:hypothetical protein [Pseudomonadota bacterium]